MKWNGKEEELYIPVKNLFEKAGYVVRAELGHCDILAQKDDTIAAVELKKSLNLDVILQATLRQRTADLSFIAVPKPERKEFTSRWRNICHLLRRLELGLILVNTTYKLFQAEVFIEPSFFDINAAKRAAGKHKKVLMTEFRERSGDYNVGGSTRKKRVTVYRELAIHIAVLLDKNGVMSTKALREAGSDKKKTTTILQDNYYGWFERVSKGRYKLTDDGVKGLEVFKSVTDTIKENINEV
jgi:hypothetical protein